MTANVHQGILFVGTNDKAVSGIIDIYFHVIY